MTISIIITDSTPAQGSAFILNKVFLDDDSVSIFVSTNHSTTGLYINNNSSLSKASSIGTSVSFVDFASAISSTTNQSSM